MNDRSSDQYIVILSGARTPFGDFGGALRDLMSSRIASGGIFAGALLLGAAAGVSAEEVRQQLNPSVILNMLARPVESPEAAFNAALKSDAAPRRALPDEGEVLPDGSVRYGRGSASVSITVKNPCPPGDLAHEAAYYRPLPGRSRR
jgi:hypothetical protein